MGRHCLIAFQHPRRTLQARAASLQAVSMPSTAGLPPSTAGTTHEGDPPASSSPSHHSSTYRVEPPSTLEPALQGAWKTVRCMDSVYRFVRWLRGLNYGELLLYVGLPVLLLVALLDVLLVVALLDGLRDFIRA